MSLSTFLTIIIPVILAFIGYGFTYFNDRRLEHKKNRLARINRQLDDFYGPLLAIIESNQTAWENFIAKYNDNPHFYKKDQNPTPEQVAEFHTWMNTVFMPNNEKLYDVIINKTSLLDEDEIPKVLLDLLAHILEFRIALKDRKDEYTEVAETSCKYPGQALLKYCEEKFQELKTEQNKLIKEKK